MFCLSYYDKHMILSHDLFIFSYNENRRVMDFGYPKYISEDFPGVNTTINAAFHKEGEKYCSLLCCVFVI